MSRVSSIEVVRRVLFRSVYPPGVLEFDELYIDALAVGLGISRLDAEARASTHALKIGWTGFQQLEEEHVRRGITPLFRIVNLAKRQVIWLPHDNPIHAERSFRKRRAVVESRCVIINAIDAMNYRQFEAVGCVACEMLGAQSVELTPPGREGGVDFYARLVVRTDNHLFARREGGIRIIGQSKKWGRPVEPDDVKTFVETMNEVKHRDPNLPYPPPPWFLAGQGPIVGWMVSEAGFNSGARARAHSHGLIYSDIIDLAELIAGCRKCLRIPSTERGQFLRQSTQEMLARVN